MYFGEQGRIKKGRIAALYHNMKNQRIIYRKL